MRTRSYPTSPIAPLPAASSSDNLADLYQVTHDEASVRQARTVFKVSCS